MTSGTDISEHRVFDRADRLATMWPGASFEAVGPGPFRAEVRRRRFPRSVLEGVAATPYRCSRSREQIDAHPRAGVLISAVVRGTTEFQGSGSAFVARAGDVVVLLPDVAFAYVCPEPGATFRVRLSEDLIDLDRARRLAPAPAPLPRTELTAVFTRFAYALLRTDGDELPGSPGSDRHLEHALTELEQGLLAELDDHPAVGRDPQAALRDAVLGFIERHLEDPALSPARIAGEFDLSLRTVHNLFALLPETPAGRIRRRRAEEAAMLLRTTSLPIGRVAETVGFGSVDAFSRAFSAAFGVSASEYRRTRHEPGLAFRF